MFQNQNTTKTNTDPEIEDIPVHTMLQDLNEVNFPGLDKENKQNMETVAQRKPLVVDNLTTAQKSSPFLNPTSEITRPETVKVNSIQANNPAPSATDTPSSTGSRKLFFVIAAALIIVIIAGSGYYFWTTRQANTAAVVDEIVPPVELIPETIPEPIPEPTPPAPQFSTDKPNYLNIENKDTPAGDNVKDILAFYANQVSQANIMTPVEFVVTDAQNNPLLFSEFATKLGINFTQPLRDNLKEAFSLFIYNDGPLTRFGLSLDSKDTTKLKSLMSFEEKTLAKELEPIFLSSDYTMEIKSYGSSTYKALPIRYANIVSPEDLSVDYAISTKNNKLLIGTTKMTLRSIIDYIENNTTSTPININPTSSPVNPSQDQVSTTPIQP
ncbi:MAG: hypothetical protein WC238_04500 [Parcubacteria group bacterium]|jgi:hypothetical protein